MVAITKKLYQKIMEITTFNNKIEELFHACRTRLRLAPG
jgi:hypothetical protein